MNPDSTNSVHLGLNVTQFKSRIAGQIGRGNVAMWTGKSVTPESTMIAKRSGGRCNSPTLMRSAGMSQRDFVNKFGLRLVTTKKNGLMTQTTAGMSLR